MDTNKIIRVYPSLFEALNGTNNKQFFGETSNIEHKLMLYLIEVMNKNNQVFLTQNNLATIFEVHRVTIMKALRLLRRKALIKCRHGVIFVNPYHVYKCNEDRYDDILLEYYEKW